jgi:hypothetical protein
MSPLWLLLIIPVCFCVGYMVCGIVAIGAQDERCTYCKYGDPFDEET